MIFFQQDRWPRWNLMSCTYMHLLIIYCFIYLPLFFTRWFTELNHNRLPTDGERRSLSVSSIGSTRVEGMCCFAHKDGTHISPNVWTQSCLAKLSATWWSHDLKKTIFESQDVWFYECKAKMGIWHRAKNDAHDEKCWCFIMKMLCFYTK